MNGWADQSDSEVVGGGKLTSSRGNNVSLGSKKRNAHFLDDDDDDEVITNALKRSHILQDNDGGDDDDDSPLGSYVAKKTQIEAPITDVTRRDAPPPKASPAAASALSNARLAVPSAAVRGGSSQASVKSERSASESARSPAASSTAVKLSLGVKAEEASPKPKLVGPHKVHQHIDYTPKLRPCDPRVPLLKPGVPCAYQVPRIEKAVEIDILTGARKRFALTEEHIEPINQWWCKESCDNDVQWTYLESRGLMFTPPYEPHGVPIIYKGKRIQLDPPAEEIATFWCQAIESDYAKKEVFIKNFMTCFLESIPDNHPIMTGEGFDGAKPKFEDFQFHLIHEHLKDKKEKETLRKKALTTEEKRVEARRKQIADGPCAYAIMEGIREKVGAFRAEPPSLFRGRGAHPKMGQVKKRIFPEDVTLNMSEDAPVPRLPHYMRGHCWKDVYHDNTVTWLSFYRDSINNSFKYVFLSPSSAVKGQKDHAKYEKARRLIKCIDKVRRNYRAKLVDTDPVERQLGTATYLIDVLALRAGNEKNTEEEADTVGCCSLRAEHLSFEEDNHVGFDFLGKDSIRYYNKVKVDGQVYKNLREFCNGAGSKDIFNKINPTILNKYLKDLMPGLSAKVFRTYNASITLQQELGRIDPSQMDIGNPEDIKAYYEEANRQVAILCNHQRAIPKQHESTMNKMQKQLLQLLDDIEECAAGIKWAKQGKKKPFQWRSSAPADTCDSERVSIVKSSWTVDKGEKKMRQLEQKKIDHELKMKTKDGSKTVATGTSRQHYCDPRISVSFCKQWEIPIEKIFNGSLRKKFPWAMYASSDFVW